MRQRTIWIVLAVIIAALVVLVWLATQTITAE
jgi:hypothetical protein